MWPRTAAGEATERARKRSREGQLILRALREHVAGAPENPAILEFGCGAGYHGEWLRLLGRCVLSDVYADGDRRHVDGATFVLCDAADAPFRSASFDLIFSNHVVEHLVRPGATFRELQRIGRAGCLYAFAVPTAVWVMLSVPAQYWDKLCNVRARLRRARGASRDVPVLAAIDGPAGETDGRGRFLPHGHGCYPGFAESLHAFRTAAWRRHFVAHGFRVVGEHPLLCYAPAAWPIVPTNRPLARVGLCASRLFVLRQASGPGAR
jgi:SAM-dependent methyltransferase